ncbi:restriction endonuclease subunit S [Holdemanella biformis]|uniref:restriction endonuclease subunit S n=1 Tax=Holdemanella biformis TaxID=1735 RepID=UPI003AB12BC3
MREYIKLCDVCDFQGGSQPPKNEWSFDLKDGYIRMLQIRDFTQSERVAPEYIKITKATKICEVDDILIARYGASLGKVLTGLAGAYNVAIMKTIPDTNVLEKKYLYYYLKSPIFQGFLLNVGSRAAQAGFNKNDLQDLLIPNITRNEQVEIVGTLERVETVIEARQNELQKLDDLIKARFVEMFGDPQINEKGFIKAPMGEYLSLLTDFSSNGSYKTLDSGVVMYDEPNYAWMVRTTDLESGDMSSIKYIDEKAYELLSKSKIFGGEIIMNKIGSAGKIYIIPKLTMPASLGRNAFMFRYDERINNIFMYYLLTSDYGQREIQQYVRGAVTKTITKDDARAVLIIVPPLELQQQFADFVQQVDKSKYDDMYIRY